MKRVLVLALAAAMLAAAVAPGASAQPPLHPHFLVLGVQVDETGEPVGFRKCVELAAGRKLPLHVHHAHVHTGRAGEALATRAGHFAVPGAPLSPFESCADIEALFD